MAQETKRRISPSARLHAIVHHLGIDNENYRAMLYANYGVLSSKELSDRQILALCHSLEGKKKNKIDEMDTARKRLIAAIGGWLEATGKMPASRERALTYIKNIACSAAQRENFNKIPLERLRSLYAAFCNKQKDFKFVDKATSAIIDSYASLN